jgi:hypothetical protein
MVAAALVQYTLQDKTISKIGVALAIVVAVALLFALALCVMAASAEPVKPDETVSSRN